MNWQRSCRPLDSRDVGAVIGLVNAPLRRQLSNLRLIDLAEEADATTVVVGGAIALGVPVDEGLLELNHREAGSEQQPRSEWRRPAVAPRRRRGHLDRGGRAMTVPPKARRKTPRRRRPAARARGAGEAPRHSALSQALTEAAKSLTSSLQRSQVLESIIRHVAGLLAPENWSLMLIDAARQELFFEIVVGEAADAIRHMRLPVGEGIAGWVVTHRQPLVIPKVADDPRFCPRMDAASAFRTSSILAAPLIFADEVLGVLELVARADQRPFVEEDLATLIPFADFCAIAIHNARTYERIEELTLTDEWTRLHNARYMRRRLADEVERADRYHHPVSAAFIDLDHFKQVNDTRGHTVGSLVLREVGEVLLSTVRNTDRAARYGGDEFVVIMPETDKGGAVALSGRIRNAVAERAFTERDGMSVRITASVGVATYPDDARDGVALLGAADRAMYLAKAQGRNRVVAAEEVTSSIGVP